MRVARGEEPETATLSNCEAGAQAKLLKMLDESLHAMSQPMTVLLCALEYGASLDSVDEMRQMMMTSQQSCERLRASVFSMQAQLREAIEAESKALR